jgi:hypothetical protein
MVEALGAMTTAQRKTILVKKGFAVGRVAFLSEEDVLIELLKTNFNMKDILIWKASR